MLFLMSRFEKKMNQDKKKRAQERMVQQLKELKRRKENEKKRGLTPLFLILKWKYNSTVVVFVLDYLPFMSWASVHPFPEVFIIHPRSPF